MVSEPPRIFLSCYFHSLQLLLPVACCTLISVCQCTLHFALFHTPTLISVWDTSTLDRFTPFSLFFLSEITSRARSLLFLSLHAQIFSSSSSFTFTSLGHLSFRHEREITPSLLFSAFSPSYLSILALVLQYG